MGIPKTWNSAAEFGKIPPKKFFFAEFFVAEIPQNDPKTRNCGIFTTTVLERKLVFW